VNLKERLEKLEQECRDRGVKLHYDDLQGEGGYCRAKDCHYIVINRRAAAETRVRIIHEALERIPRTAPAFVAAPGEQAAGFEPGSVSVEEVTTKTQRG